MDSDNASVLKMSASLMTKDTYETTSNPPGSVRSFSTFGDSACGEPLLAQHLVVNFTPNKEIDTDFVQEKVCAFWEFVDCRPELRNILVLPETDLFRMSESSDILPDVKHENRQIFHHKALSKVRTAVSMLEFVEEKGASNRTHVKYNERTQTTVFCQTKNESDVRNMCKNMRQWDEQHPKSMQCPRHPLTNCQHKQ